MRSFNKPELEMLEFETEEIMAVSDIPGAGGTGSDNGAIDEGIEDGGIEET